MDEKRVRALLLILGIDEIPRKFFYSSITMYIWSLIQIHSSEALAPLARLSSPP